MQPRPGRQRAAVSGKRKEPGRAPRPRLRATYSRTAGVRHLRLLRNMLTAGYLEDWRWNATLSGAPQGGVTSPIPSGIYLHKLDEFVENTLIPEYTRGEARNRNKEYGRVTAAYAYARKKGDREKARDLKRRQARLPIGNCDDPGYRRLRYVRYADLCRARHKSA